ncbi:MAG: hypothetical protein MAG715_00278 [Methanonatronarchaeales archaeon]|nr:hypothetical protein [Methanonatronarchaeales archaeon]
MHPGSRDWRPHSITMAMSETVTVWGGVVAIAVLMVLSALFSSSEIAMFSLARHKLDALVEERNPRAELVTRLREDPHRLLVTILVGNNVVNIAMTSVATALFVIYLPREQAVVATTVVISFLVLVFGESTPKSYAVEHPVPWALRVSGFLHATQRLLYPAVVFFDHLTRVVNRLTGGRSDIETSYMTRGEIEHIIRTGEEEGVIEQDERRMIESVFKLSNTITKEVMTPRLDIVAVPDTADLEEVLTTCIENDVTTVPVYSEVLDEIRGLADIKGVSRAIRKGGELEDVVKPTLFVPETKEIDELLKEMQERRIHMAIVIDEFGSTEGIVTVEDIVEEIVGEIFDIGEEVPIERLDDSTLLVKGDVNVDEVNEVLGVEIPEEAEFETVAGFIYNHIGRLVEEGEQLRHGGALLTVEEAYRTRILKVRVERVPSEEGEGDEETDGEG